MISNALLQILNDGQFHSESRLATTLKSDPALLRKELEALQESGLEIEYQPDSGYRLSPGIKLLDKTRVLSSLARSVRDSFQTVDFRLTIDSTNSEAMRYARAGNKGKALFVAERQEQGRGRRGRNWHSPMARNIYMTLVYPISHQPDAMLGLSLVAALSLVKALSDLKLTGMDKLNVKWPNDVWLDKKKLAGILLELHHQQEGSHQVIIGIGINVNMPAGSLESIDQAATDLSSHGNPGLDRNLILSQLIQQLDVDIACFVQQGFTSFQPLWQQYDVYHNLHVEVRTGDRLLQGIVKGVTDSGALILETSMGTETIVGGELAPSIRAVGDD